ncbi:hypothetical protein DID96_30530 [Burkholderia sp. Bp8963]|nr:hypothetical protein DID96_30530 [Burkholderia sp. Bp8963]
MDRGGGRGLQDMSPWIWNADAASRYRMPGITQRPCQARSCEETCNALIWRGFSLSDVWAASAAFRNFGIRVACRPRFRPCAGPRHIAGGDFLPTIAS